MGASLFKHGWFTLAIGDQLNLQLLSMKDFALETEDYRSSVLGNLDESQICILQYHGAMTSASWDRGGIKRPPSPLLPSLTAQAPSILPDSFSYWEATSLQDSGLLSELCASVSTNISQAKMWAGQSYRGSGGKGEPLSNLVSLSGLR